MRSQSAIAKPREEDMEDNTTVENPTTETPETEENTVESPTSETPDTPAVDDNESESPTSESPEDEGTPAVPDDSTSTPEAEMPSTPAPTSGNTSTFKVTNFVGGAAEAQITLAETAEGIRVTVEATNPIIDLRGLFFNLTDDSLLDGLVVTGADVTDFKFGPAGSVNQVSGNPSIAPRSFDAGIEIGTSGPAQDEIVTTTFVISHSSASLTLADFAGQKFGVRTQNGKLEGMAPGGMEMPDADGDSAIDPVDSTGDDSSGASNGSTDDSSSDSTDGDMMSDHLFIGKSFGKFTGPVEENADAVVKLSGENGGTDNRFEWGVAAEDSFTNVVQFDGSDFGAKIGETFKLGQLFYQNGTTNRNFNGDFGFSLSLDIDGTDNDPESFDFFFNILNTPNTTGDAVEDGDRLQFSTGGLSAQTFAFDGKTYTIELSGFSTDGGETTRGGFDSPEESFAIASLYGKIVEIPAEAIEAFEPLPDEDVQAITEAGGVLLGGDENSNGAVAGSVILQSEAQLSVVWSISTSATLAFVNGQAFQLPDGTVAADLDALGTDAVNGSDSNETIDGTEDNDIISAGGGDDVVEGDEGNDVLCAHDGNDRVEGGSGIDIVNGNQGDDNVMGGDGDDVVRGGKGNDRVMGGEGNDAIYGDLGFDELTGGGGADTFVLRAEFDVTLQVSLSSAMIADFEIGVDRIALDAELVASFEVGDFNGDGVNDVGIKLENGAFFGYVLNVEDTTKVQESIVQVPEADLVA
ncbi:MAG TPA: choice-of-anchor K domain-containing protein [Oscillatoriales cyanobacterium M59_W2019_021]|nr:choice-of-anchor K domain-containing protein [Oscillatoriales cyanobacterium M4454_W2019_049]HIK49538.1 choice-of-anchor K domain-containing protein [Oscillatoriales cyanobacterium M59_W2019_021]